MPMKDEAMTCFNGRGMAALSGSNAQLKGLSMAVLNMGAARPKGKRSQS